jgi:hypothetical protein
MKGMAYGHLRDPDNMDGRQCIPCKTLHTQARKAKDPEGIKKYFQERWAREKKENYARKAEGRKTKKGKMYLRRAHLVTTYGLTMAQLEAMFEQQEGKCAICQDQLVMFKNRGEEGLVAHVDHDHITGQTRSLLCFRCNAGIGHFEDNIERMEEAISYLKRWQAAKK